MKIKCPVCQGFGGELDRFEHNKWNKCIFCKGEGKVDSIALFANTESVERITALENAIKSLTDLGDGLYVRWETTYGYGYESRHPYCVYCGETWDRESETDAHKDDCPIVIARRLLDENID